MGTAVIVRVGRVGGTVRVVTLSQPTITEAIKRIRFTAKDPFETSRWEIKIVTRNQMSAAIPPAQFDVFEVKENDTVLAVHSCGGHLPSQKEKE